MYVTSVLLDPLSLRTDQAASPSPEAGHLKSNSLVPQYSHFFATPHARLLPRLLVHLSFNSSYRYFPHTRVPRNLPHLAMNSILQCLTNIFFHVHTIPSLPYLAMNSIMRFVANILFFNTHDLLIAYLTLPCHEYFPSIFSIHTRFPRH